MSVEPWASPRDQAAAEHDAHAASSQDQEQRPDQQCVDSFWSEVETIRQGSGYADLDCTKRESRQSEGRYWGGEVGVGGGVSVHEVMPSPWQQIRCQSCSKEALVTVTTLSNTLCQGV